MAGKVVETRYAPLQVRLLTPPPLPPACEVGGCLCGEGVPHRDVLDEMSSLFFNAIVKHMSVTCELLSPN